MSGGEGGSDDEGQRLRYEGLDLQHDMLQESRRVEEYEKLNRISGAYTAGLHVGKRRGALMTHL